MTAKTGQKLPKPANGLVSRDLGGGEYVVLNTGTNEAHALQGIVGTVWRAANEGEWPELPTEEIDEAIEALTSRGLLAAPAGMSRRVLLQGAGAAAVGVGIMSIGIPAASAAGSLHGTVTFNLHDEVATYNSTNTANNSSSHGTPDFTFYQSDSTNGGGGTSAWTTTELQANGTLNYFASSTTNGEWAAVSHSNPTQPIIGPFSSSPFNGVSATPNAESGSSGNGTGAVVEFVVPSPPAGTYQSGATLTVTAQVTSTSGTAELYVVTAGTSGTTTTNLITPATVTSTSATSATISIGTAVAGTRYFVALQDKSSTTAVVQLQITTSFPWSN